MVEVSTIITQYWIGVALIQIVFIGPAFLVFRYRRSDVIKRRGPFLLILGAVIGSLCASSALAAMDYFTNALEYGCFRRLINTTLFYPMFLLTYVLRASYLVCLDTIQKHRLKMNKQSAEEHSPLTLDLLERISFFFHQTTIKEAKRLRTGDSKSRVTGVMPSSSSGSFKWIKRAVYSYEFAMIKWFLLYVMAAGIIILVTILCRPDVFNVKCQIDVLWGMNGLRIFFSLFCLILLTKINTINDKLNIKHELQASMSTFIVGVLLYFITTYITSLRWVGPTIWTGLSTVICHFITVIGPLVQYYVRKQSAKNFNVNQETFSSVLSDRESFEILKNMMLEEFCVENALFAERYQRLKGAKIPDATQKTVSPELNDDGIRSVPLVPDNKMNSNAIKSIYEDFIKSNAIYELNIPDSVKTRIELQIKEASKKNTALVIEMIEPVAIEVYRMIYCNTFRRFIQNKAMREN